MPVNRTMDGNITSLTNQVKRTIGTANANIVKNATEYTTENNRSVSIP